MYRKRLTTPDPSPQGGGKQKQRPDRSPPPLWGRVRVGAGREAPVLKVWEGRGLGTVIPLRMVERPREMVARVPPGAKL